MPYGFWMLSMLLLLVSCTASADSSIQPAISDTTIPATSEAASATPSLLSITTTAVAVEPVSLVDPALPLATAGQEGWHFQRTARANVDVDKDEERVWVIANALDNNGEPAWEDAHIWQVYIEEPTGERTYLFSRWVSFGSIEALFGTPEANEARPIVLIQKAATGVSVYRVYYRAQGQTQAQELLNVRTDGFIAAPTE